MKYGKLASAAIALTLSTDVNAVLISTDWQTSGDNLVTTDTISGLDWLDLTETNGMSYNMVVSQLVDGGSFDGFRYATTNEVVDLWFNNFGVDLYIGRSSFEMGPIDPGIEAAVSFFGNPVGGSPYFAGYGVTGLTSSLSDSLGSYPYHCGDQPQVNCRDIIGAYSDYNQNFYQSPQHTHEHVDSTDPYFGSYLVKETVVPLPASVWLFFSGMIGLIGFARRKKA